MVESHLIFEILHINLKDHYDAMFPRVPTRPVRQRQRLTLGNFITLANLTKLGSISSLPRLLRFWTLAGGFEGCGLFINLWTVYAGDKYIK